MALEIAPEISVVRPDPSNPLGWALRSRADGVTDVFFFSDAAEVDRAVAALVGAHENDVDAP